MAHPAGLIPTMRATDPPPLRQPDQRTQNEERVVKQYKVFRHPSGALACVQPGWSWPAFLGGCFWAFGQKLWGQGAIGLVALGGLVVLIAETVSTGAELALGVALVGCHLVFGLSGQAWRIQHLRRSGYQHADTVTAADPDGALALSIRDRRWRVPKGVSPS